RVPLGIKVEVRASQSVWNEARLFTGQAAGKACSWLPPGNRDNCFACIVPRGTLVSPPFVVLRQCKWTRFKTANGQNPAVNEDIQFLRGFPTKAFSAQMAPRASHRISPLRPVRVLRRAADRARRRQKPSGEEPSRPAGDGKRFLQPAYPASALERNFAS